MNEDVKKLAASRPLAVATELGATELNALTVHAKRIILIGELQTLKSPNGEWCFLDSLRLLSRITGNLEVVIPDGLEEFQRKVDELIKMLWCPGTVRRVEEAHVVFDGADSILNIGASVHADLPWTSILASGWVARCTSGPSPLQIDPDLANPVSCMLAASLGVTEVFKRIYGVPAEKAAPMIDAAFSLFEMSTEFENVGPALPPSIALPDTLVLGAGAIGNGLILLLSQLPLSGHVHLMDKQNFGIENHGTCLLLDSADWIGKPKATMLVDWLRVHSNLGVDGEMSTIEDAMANSSFQKSIDLVINGLDDIAARRAVQKLWPSLLVDGAINSAGAAVVTYCAAQRGFACLRCTFTEPNQNHVALQANVTGLDPQSLEGDQNRPICDDDIAMADQEKREWLRDQQRQGKTICSTISAGMANDLGLALPKGFRPSVPFVATASAALVIAQVLRSLLWPEQRFVHELQFSSLFVGTHTAVKLSRLTSPDCECTKNRRLIDTLISKRKELHYFANN